MGLIEVKTSHNIVLQHKLASLGQRLAAFLLDLGLVMIYTWIFAFAIGFETNLYYLFIFPVFFVYHLLMETFNKGQSLGKRAVKIRVVSVDRKDLPIQSILIRWSFRLLDILFTLGLLAIISIFGSEKKQRIGDKLAGTIVVSLKNQSKYSLQKLVDLGSIDRQIKYPEIIQYSDEDMLIVKAVLNRLKTANNKMSRQAASDLANKINDELNLPPLKVKTSKFLKEVLEDYILLTR